MAALQEETPWSPPGWTGWGARPGSCSPWPKHDEAEDARLRVLNPGGGDVDTRTPMGSMMIIVMALPAQRELSAVTDQGVVVGPILWSAPGCR